MTIHSTNGGGIQKEYDDQLNLTSMKKMRLLGPLDEDGTVKMDEDTNCYSINDEDAAAINHHAHPPNRRQRRFRSTIRVMAGNATKELSVQRSSSQKFDSILMASFSAALCLIFGYFQLTRVSSNDFTSHVLVLSLAAINGTIYTCSTTTNGERISVVIKCTSILLVSWMFIFVSTSSCLNCIRLAGTGAWVFQSNSFVSFLFGQSPGCESQQACHKCIGTLADILMVGNYFSLQSRGEKSVIHDDINLEHIQSKPKLVNWYNDWTEDTTKLDLQAFNSALIYALAKDGKLTPESTSEIMKTILCSPASRIDKPDPVTYMQSLKHPRFTSEDTSSITFEQLALIMRGDMLKELGASVCFMLRFALFVENDPKLEISSTSNTQLFPSMNEDDMQTTDITSQLPGIVIPGIDQDIDVEGANIGRIKNLMDIYTLFPFEDKALYFNTTEEYFAFFRWEIEPTIMDSWYFPHWLIKDGSKKDQIADLMSDRVKGDSMYQLSLQDAGSDIVLGERAIYGAGARFLSPLLLPGDDNYEFHLHMKHDQFLTNDHREYFRYTNKPSPEQLLKMFHSFYKKNPKKGSNFIKKMFTKKDSLEIYRKNVLQIDFGFVATLPFREDFFAPGVILYLDSKSLLPIGIWESSRSKLFLPNSGRDWEHAKFMFRVCERAISAAFHVQESHFGWSNALANSAWQTLPHDHGLRALVKPFTLNVHSVNQAAYHMLVRDHSILTHASGLTTKGVIATFSQVFQTINFGESLPDFLESTSLSSTIDTSNIPLYTQGKLVYEATRQFVDEFVTFLYPTEEDLVQDGDVQLFWYHINTLGRHLDPCVCGLDAELFFGSDTKWPSFESTQTCQQLLDFTKFKAEDSMVYRRKLWCNNGSFDRILAFREMIESGCKVNPECEEVKYDTFAMRADMGLPALTSRSQLVDFLATAFWYVSFGHELNSDNISYFVDPKYSSVRMREYDGDGALPIVSDVGSYVFGASIASLTTVRCPPLLADWSPLYDRYANMQDDPSSTYEKLHTIHLRYKHKLLDLATKFLKESSGRPVNQRTNVFNPATTASSVSV